MNKVSLSGPYFLKKSRHKHFLRIMRISFFLLFVLIFSAHAVNTNSQNIRITVQANNTSLKDVLNMIEKQTDYLFVYNNNVDTNQKIAVNVVEQPTKAVLDNLLKGIGLDYVVEGSYIIVSTKNLKEQREQQEKKKITGIITDKNGEPIIGANIAEKGTTNGVITDINGAFSISVSPNSILQVTYIGYITQELSTQKETFHNIVLEEDTQALDEVIVIGYGTAQRKDFTGSVSSVKLENSAMSLLPNMNALESLKGNVSGVNIGTTNTSGGEPDMLIRGQNSINGSNNPLIVLDGVIFLGSLSDINPNDIASFDILKDAVSAAAYGSRAANGIIAISTKKGRSPKPLITLNTSVGFQTWPNRPVMMKGDEWIKTVNDVAGNAPGTTSWLKKGELENYELGKETNWLDEVTRTGIIQEYQLAVSGSAKNMNYYLSGAFNDNKGVVLGDDFDRISIFGKVNTDITSWLNIGVDANYSRRDYSGIGANIGQAQKLTPYGVMYRDDKGNLEKHPREVGSMNPLWGVNDGTIDNKDIRQNFRLNSYASISLPWVKGLNYRINLLYNIDQIHQGNFYYEDYYVNEGNGLDRYSPSALQSLLSKANGNLLNSQTNSYVFDNILNYKNTFGKHTIEGTLVATRDYAKYQIINTTGSDFSENGNTTLGMWGLHKAKIQKVDLNASNKNANKRTNIGYLARANYSYAGKYYFTGSIRRDGASIFGTNKKWGTFAAAGLAWRISEEQFMKKLKPLDNLKLKLSWGQNGNQGVDPYATLSKVANGSTSNIRYEFSNTGEEIYYGLIQNSLGNQELGWESTNAWNVGFESTWLNNRLFVDMDVYISKTYDQIFKRTIPIMTGFQTIITSMGQVNNNGVELTVRSININEKDWNWSTSVTFWKNNNKLVKLYGEDLNKDGKEDDDIANSLFIGKSLGAIYGYKQIGIVQEDDTEYIKSTGSTPGSPKYEDIDGIPGISSDDRTILGYNKENFRLNMGNTIRYKNLELYVLITGIFGGNNHYLKSNPRAFMTGGTGVYVDNMPSKPYWTPENKSNVYPSAPFSGDGRYLGLQSRAFVRLQDISLSYTFNSSWIDSAKINSLKIFFAAKNIATLTNWKGLDPEAGIGYLDNKYPVTSTYSLGVNISF